MENQKEPCCPQADINNKNIKRLAIIKGFAETINRNSAENGSNTPDFILAEYLTDCLTAFDRAVTLRCRWYGHPLAKDTPDVEVYQE